MTEGIAVVPPSLPPPTYSRPLYAGLNPYIPTYYSPPANSFWDPWLASWRERELALDATWIEAQRQNAYGRYRDAVIENNQKFLADVIANADKVEKGLRSQIAAGDVELLKLRKQFEDEKSAKEVAHLAELSSLQAQLADAQAKLAAEREAREALALSNKALTSQLALAESTHAKEIAMQRELVSAARQETQKATLERDAALSESAALAAKVQGLDARLTAEKLQNASLLKRDDEMRHLVADKELAIHQLKADVSGALNKSTVVPLPGLVRY